MPLNTSSADESAFEQRSIRKRVHVTALKQTSKPTQKPPRKKRAPKQTNTLKSSFFQNTTNSESMNLAIALSLSLSESSSTPGEQHVKLDEMHETIQDCLKKNTTHKPLEAFGFKKYAQPLRSELLDNPPKKKLLTNQLKLRKRPFRCIMPVLFRRTNEERLKLKADKASEILSRDRPCSVAKDFYGNIFNNVITPGTILDECYAFNKPLFRMCDLSEKKNSRYYVENLISPSQSKPGALLKDWSKIRGRCRTPPLELFECKKAISRQSPVYELDDIVTEALGETDIINESMDGSMSKIISDSSNTSVNHFVSQCTDELTDKIIESTNQSNNLDEQCPEVYCSSPDIFMEEVYADPDMDRCGDHSDDDIFIVEDYEHNNSKVIQQFSGSKEMSVDVNVDGNAAKDYAGNVDNMDDLPAVFIAGNNSKKHSIINESIDLTQEDKTNSLEPGKTTLLTLSLSSESSHNSQENAITNENNDTGVDIFLCDDTSDPVELQKTNEELCGKLQNDVNYQSLSKNVQDSMTENLKSSQSLEESQNGSIVIDDDELNYSCIKSHNIGNSIICIDSDDECAVKSRSIRVSKFPKSYSESCLSSKSSFTLNERISECFETNENIATRSSLNSRFFEELEEHYKDDSNVLKQCLTEQPLDVASVNLDKHEDKTTPKTRIIMKKKITPMPNFDKMNTPDIMKNLDSYGIKPLKKNAAKNLLKYIYDQTHCSKETLTTKFPRSKSFKENKISKDVESNLTKTKRRSKLIQTPSKFSKTPFKLLVDQSPIFERQMSSKVASCPVPFDIVWFNYVNENVDVFRKILQYEPLQIEDIYVHFRELGFKFHVDDIIAFLDRKCITIRTKQNKSRRKR